MNRKPIESYKDFKSVVESDKWYTTMTLISELKKRDPERFNEYKKRYDSETRMRQSRGYRAIDGWIKDTFSM